MAADNAEAQTPKKNHFRDSVMSLRRACVNRRAHQGAAVDASDKPSCDAPRSSAPPYVAGQLISAGAVCPVVIRAAGHRAQAVVCGQHELPRLVGGQLWMVVHQVSGYLSTRHLPNP